MNNRSLNCFYDLSVSPCSYDFFAFLISAELHRVRNGFDSLKLIFVPGPEKGYRLDNLRTFEQNDNFFKASEGELASRAFFVMAPLEVRLLLGVRVKRFVIPTKRPFSFNPSHVPPLKESWGEKFFKFPSFLTL